MSRDFDATLEDCLAKMGAGASVEACLVDHPHAAERLRPLLELASELQTVVTPEPKAAAREAGRQRMLNAAAQRGRVRQARPGL